MQNFGGKTKCNMGNSRIENGADKTSQKGKIVHSASKKTLNDPRCLTSTHLITFLFSIVFYHRSKLSKAFFREWRACLSFTLSLVQ